jgi:hypothetical protein
VDAAAICGLPFGDAAPAGLEYRVFASLTIRTFIGDLANCTNSQATPSVHFNYVAALGKHFLRLAQFGPFLRRKFLNSTSMDQMGRLAFPSELPGVNRNDLTAAASHSPRSR